MTEKAAREVWVIWTFDRDRLKFFGAVESEAKAQADVDALHRVSPARFHYAPVMLVGWAFNREDGRAYSNDDPGAKSSGSVQ